MNRHLPFSTFIINSLLVSLLFGRDPQVRELRGKREIAFSRGEQAVRVTDAEVLEARGIDGPKGIRIATWKEGRDGNIQDFYAIDAPGADAPIVRPANYSLHLLGASNDPLTEPIEAPLGLAADETTRHYVVQFHTQPLDEYRAEIASLGGKIIEYLPEHTYIVEMEPEVASNIEEQPWVRFVHPLDPGFRLQGSLIPELRSDEAFGDPRRVMVAVFDPGKTRAVARDIELLGGRVHSVAPEAASLVATLTRKQLLTVAKLDEVSSIGTLSQPSTLMDKARAIGYAKRVDDITGFNGEGVIGEIMDDHAPNVDHPAFNGLVSLAHQGFISNAFACELDDLALPLVPEPGCQLPPPPAISHATSVLGILFWRVTQFPMLPIDARGMIPEGKAVYASYCSLPGNLGTCPGDGSRQVETCQLMAQTPANCCGNDSNCPYKAVFQSNSWGTRSGAYTLADSGTLDVSIFKFDVSILHAQGNDGGGAGRAQAFAKNVVSVGGVFHYDTVTTTDDTWTSSDPDCYKSPSTGRLTRRGLQ